MPRPRPPSRVEAVATPLFGICWFGDPGNGTSIVAYCGGGGSAATGVKNLITVRMSTPAEEEAGGDENVLQISTGDQVGVSLTIVKNPFTNILKLYVALGGKVQVFSLPEGKLVDEVSVGDNVNTVAVNALADKIAVGCESGTVKIFSIMSNKDDKNAKEEIDAIPICTLEGHAKAVCAVAFAPRENIVVSSAKDGTARVWKNDKCISTLTCSIEDPKVPPPKRAQQVLVRGCAFGDLLGKQIFTVASGRRGRAFLSKWEQEGSGEYKLIKRTGCSPCPISAMSISGDAGMLALGAVDGTIILWGVERWKPTKSFFEVHDLPVTCIAARPYPVPLRCDEEGLQMNALSASADSQLAWLTLQRRGPRSSQSSDFSLKRFVNRMVRWAILAWILYPVAEEMWEKCEDEWKENGYGKAWECIHHDVLIAPASRPGIAVPPY